MRKSHAMQFRSEKITKSVIFSLRIDFVFTRNPPSENETNNYVAKIRLVTFLNPITPRRTQVSPFTEISILFYEGIIKKISYERRAYESVDEKSLS